MTFHTLTLMARCVFYGFLLGPVPKEEEAIAWIKGSHLWDKLYIRTRFQEGHPDDGKAGVVNGKSYDITPDILENKR